MSNATFTTLAGPQCGDASKIVGTWGAYPWNNFAILPFGAGGTSNPVSVDAGIYTGFHTSSTYQRGTANQLGGSTIYQLECTVGGFLADTPPDNAITYGITWSIPSGIANDPGFNPNDQPGRVVAGAPQIRPWATTTDNPDLVIEFNARIPTANIVGTPDINNRPSGQFNIDFYVLDASTGKFFSYIINVFSGPSGGGWGSGSAQHDGQFPFISTSLQAEGTGAYVNDYYNRSPSSHGGTSSPWGEWRFFRVHIGREHITRAAQAINAKYGTGLSTDPANYLLTSAGIIEEHANRTGSSIFMGSSFSEMKISLATDTPAPPSGLGTPQLIGPSGAVTSPTTFSWYYVPDALFYEVYVQNLSGGASFDWSWARASVGCGPSVVCTTPAMYLDPGQTYSWFVRAQTYSQTGSWSTPVTITTPATNWALASNGGSAWASSEYGSGFPASAVIDGVRTSQMWGAGGAWNDATANSWGDYLVVNLAQTRTLNRIVVYTLQDDVYSTTEPTGSTTFTSYGITDYSVYVWNGSTWVEVGSASGNNFVKRTFDFAPIAGSAVLVEVWNGHTYSVLTEVEAYGQ